VLGFGLQSLHALVVVSAANCSTVALELHVTEKGEAAE
jgi:hypothetical protein